MDSISWGGGQAAFGGAISAETGSSFSVEDCRFEGNTANSGGALSARNASGSVRRCLFVNNSARISGGAIYMELSPLSIDNCVFTGNIAGASGNRISGGGAVYAHSSGPSIQNCSFYQNTVRWQQNGGGAIFNFIASTLIANSILWGNTATIGPQVYNHVLSSPTILNSLVDQVGFESGNGNLRDDPSWRNPAAGDFKLNPNSPCIDAGSGNVPGLPATDFDGNPRVVGAGVDMGAFESTD